MKKIRVLFPYVGDTIGGSHVSSSVLIDGLKKSDQFEPVVLLHEIDGPLAGWLKNRGIEFIHVPVPAYVSTSTKHPFQELRNAIKVTRVLRRVIRDYNIQIVHTNDLRMHMTWLLPTRLSQAKQVWHNRRRSSDSLIWGLIIRQTGHLFGVSEFSTKGFRRWLPDHRLSRLDNPFHDPVHIDKAKARSTIRQRLKLPEDGLVIITIGTASRLKRTEEFIRIAGAMKSTMKRPARFVVLGRIDQCRADLEKLIDELGVEEQVVLAGFQHDVEDWTAAADLQIAPAVDEPLGRGIIESMLLATPVVASDSGGNAEIFVDPSLGRLCPLDDIDAFASATTELLNNPQELQQMAEHARAYALKRFTADKHIQRVKQVYLSLASWRLPQ